MEWAELPPLFPAFAAPEQWLPILRKHAELLEAAAPRVRVSSVSAPESVQRHYAEAIETLRLAAAVCALDDAVIADLGSGGGFPGLVWAALLPGARLHLIEPLKKRATLLEEMARDLDLPNVTVYAERGEEAGRGPLRDRADLVTARAVASLPELLEYVAPLCHTEGTIVLPKGSRLESELPAATAALRELRCEVTAVVPMRAEISEFGRVLMLRKMGSTPRIYPRRPGLPRQQPLGNRSTV